MWIVLVIAVVVVGVALVVFVEYRGNRVNPRGGRATGTTLSRARQARRNVESINTATSRFWDAPWRD